MKAVRIHSFGGPEVLVYEDSPEPIAGPAEVLVKVHGAGVNPVDWKSRQGLAVASQLGEPPIILGWDIAGEVVALGSEVTIFASGDRVFALSRFPRQAGGYGEYAAVPVGDLAQAPRSIELVRASAVPLAALTAWQALFDVAELAAGQTVLIHAAAGGVGHFAVQLAKWKGARVIGTASAGNRSFVEELGADEVIDYTTTGFESGARDVDVVLDTVGGGVRERSWQILRPGGVLVALVGPLSAEDVPNGVRGVRHLVKPSGVQLAKVAELIDAGHVLPFVEHILPLSAAAQAHAISEQEHTRGKIVLHP